MERQPVPVYIGYYATVATHHDASRPSKMMGNHFPALYDKPQLNQLPLNAQRSMTSLPRDIAAKMRRHHGI